MSLLSIFISIFAIVAIISFFTKVPSTNPALPATLFYVKNGADFLGRCLTLLPSTLPRLIFVLLSDPSLHSPCSLHQEPKDAAYSGHSPLRRDAPVFPLCVQPPVPV